MRAAVYCRVSSEEQEREGTSLQTQLEAGLKYCQDKGYNIAYQFTEAWSGLTLDRPKLNELCELIRASDIDVVVVYCLDRLSRDPTHGVILIEEMEKHNITLEAVTETVDSSDLGKLISYIRGFASKLESEKIRERTMRGKRARLKEGKLPQGTGIGIYGYTWDKEAKKRVIRQNEALVVKRVFDLVAQGYSVYTVAKELNSQGILSKAGLAWHPLTIRRIVTNPAYCGRTYFNRTKREGKTKVVRRPKEEWVTLPNVTPAIVDMALFEKAQQALKQPRSRPGKALVEYLLRGYVYCATCGGRLVGTMISRKFRYYRCANTKPTTIKAATCHESYIKANWLETVAWGSVKALLTDPKLLVDQVKRTLDGRKGTSQSEKEIDRQIGKLRRQLKGYEGQHKRLVNLLRFDEISQDDILDELNRIKADKKADEDRITELLTMKPKLQELRAAKVRLEEWYEIARRNIDYSDSESKRLAFKALGLKVYASRDKADIQGIIPVDLVTIEQTSACLFSWTNTYSGAQNPQGLKPSKIILQPVQLVK